MKRIQLFFIISILIVVFKPAHSQNIVQSFIKTNITGNTMFGISTSSAGDINKDGYDDVIVGASNYDTYRGRAYIFLGGSSMDSIADVTLTGSVIQECFGYSVSGAGDINNDGYDDVIVGAYLYNSEAGRAYVYLGGSSMNNTVDLYIESDGSGTNHVGISVSGAGDVNNDGYDDVIVGASGYTSSTGQAYVYYGGSTLNNVADVTLSATVTSNYFGCSVSSAGDLNNDGYDDVIVGSYGYNGNEGRVYVYLGGNGMNSTADLVISGEALNNYFGYSVSEAGDVNNDGYDDFVVGASRYSTYTGRAYLFYGGSVLDGVADVTMTGENTGDNFGKSVSGAGDVNNDGYDDVIVGSEGYDSYSGRAYLFSGGSSMDNVADLTFSGNETGSYFGCSVSKAGDVNGDGYDDVIVGAYCHSSNNGLSKIYYGDDELVDNKELTLAGELLDNYFGYSVSNAGDVNGDGYDDVIIGAYRNNLYTGAAYIYYGGIEMDDTVDVALTGEIVKTSSGSIQGTYFGYSVAGAGDVNNDGYDDVIVGAYFYNYRMGRAYIFFGGTSMDNTADVTMTGDAIEYYFGRSVAGAGDLNGDGYSDVIVGVPAYNSSTGRAYIYYGGSSMNNVADVTIDGSATGVLLGYSLAGAGDVNKDGYDDVIVGSFGYSSEKGRADLYLGGSSMNSTSDLTFTGNVTGNRFGYAVSGAGDVNGDGYADIIIGAYAYSSLTGQAYLFYGGSSMNATVDVTFAGEAASSNFGWSVSDAGDVNNDGYDDVIVGTNNYGRAYIYYGGSSMNNTADYTLIGENSNKYFGSSVSGAGDINADGYDDVIIGTYTYSSNGKAYLYSLSPKPSVSTKAVSAITKIKATGNGTITYLGTSNPTGYGFCWNTSGSPDLTSNIINLGATSSTGSFSGQISSLSAGTTYYLKAYATNSSGTSFGKEVSFTTLKNDQTITFNSLDSVNYGDSSFILSATASSGLTVSYESSDTTVAVISGDTVTIVGAGNSVITASQAGNSQYNAAANVTQSLTVKKAVLTIIAATIAKEWGTEYLFSGTEFTASGLIGSDNVASVDLSSTGVSSDASKGNYAISISINNSSGTGLGNYDITCIEGLMFVLDAINEVNDTTLTDGSIACFDAIEDIYIAEDDGVILESGSSSTFIAGNSIHFLPGFYAMEGSVMDAYITSTVSYCEMTVSKSVTNLSVSKDIKEVVGDNEFAVQDIKVYPNPNGGEFTIELTNVDSGSAIVVYNLLGEKIIQFIFQQNIDQKINLEGIEKGIYFIGVSDGKNRLMRKMVVR